MERSRFKKERIIGRLREQEAGMATGDVHRKHGISSARFYSWKAKRGGTQISDVRNLKALEAENAMLKQIYAEATLDNGSLNDLPSLKWRRPPRSG